MTDDPRNRTDHAEEARALLADAESLLAATQAQVHATLAMVEQLRLMNLFQSGAIGGGPMNDHIPGEVQSYLRREWPDVAATLGVSR